MIMKNPLGYLIFYITNVCDLNCDNCSYLNNYPVKGHQRWKDNEETCRQWAKKINPALITILGGEPMLNPDFLLWVKGLASIWPDTAIRIITNGTQLDRWPDLYDILLDHQGRIILSISNHNEHTKNSDIEKIKKFLRGKISNKDNKNKDLRLWVWKKIYNSVKDHSWPDVNSIEEYHALPSNVKKELKEIHRVNIDDFVVNDEPVEDYELFVDENGIRVNWARWDEFGQSAIKFDPEKQSMTLHQSDPDIAVKACHGGECAHIKDGKLYKCEVMGILPDMFEQNFPLDVSQEDKELILSYQPAMPTWDDERLQNFIDGLHNRDPIPQCKFCPEKRITTKIHSTSKKIKIVKRSTHPSTIPVGP